MATTGQSSMINLLEERYLPSWDLEIANAISEPGLSNAQIADQVLQLFGDRPAFAWRQQTASELADRFEYISFCELRNQVVSLASFLVHAENFRIRPGQTVATIGFAGPEYAAVLIALARIGAVALPLQSNASVDQIRSIVSEAEPVAFAASGETAERLIQALDGRNEAATLLVFDQADGLRMAGQLDNLAGRQLIAFEEALAVGANLPLVEVFVPQPGSDPLNSIYYTSGSTGSPKGAMYTERNVSPWWQTALMPPGVSLHYQPLSHTFGLSSIFMALTNGGLSCFTARSDLSTLLEDLVLVKPTNLTLVPRVCELLYQRAEAIRERSAGHDFEHLRNQLLGGRVVAAVTGSAPLSPELRDFMQSLLGFSLMDGYGTTETGMIAINGRVASPPVVDYRLIDVPESGYFSTDKPFPRGELIVRTSRLIAGYFGREDLNAKLVDADGYYHTGDIMAELGPGVIEYLDRANNVLKLSQGEFVAIAKLEALYTGGAPALRQVYLYGNSSRSFLLGVVVPNPQALPEAAQEGRLKDILLGEIRRIAADNELQSYEVPRDILVETTPFSVDNGLLAAIGKYVRPAFAVRYQERLEALYGEIGDRQDADLQALRASIGSTSVADALKRAVELTLGTTVTGDATQHSFSKLGGDSLAALSFSLLMEDLFGVSVDVGEILHPSATLASLALKIENRGNAGLDTRKACDAIHGANAQLLRASDLTLNQFISAETLDGATERIEKPLGQIQHVLLTGANGFLGRFLCLEWLERLKARGGRLTCIARGKNDLEARSRVVSAFGTADPDLMKYYEELSEGTLEVIAGDIAEQRFGLSEQKWSELAASVDLIVHPAALVNHKLPYRQLFQANVSGTAEIVRLALSGKTKRISNVSTIAATSNRGSIPILESADITEQLPVWQLSDRYADGYAASKWAAEVLLREANAVYRVPVVNFRSNMILAHRRFVGQLNVPDVFTRMIYSIAEAGIAPESFYDNCSVSAHYEGLPVDFIARSMVAISDAMCSDFRDYHVLNPNEDGISLDTFVDWIDQAGYQVDRISDFAEWYRRFEGVLRNLPEDRRSMTSLPVLEMFAVPAPAIAGSSVSAEAYVSAVRTHLSDEPNIPSITAGFIYKYIKDLQVLRVLDALNAPQLDAQANSPV